MQKREPYLRKEIVQTGKLLYQKGLIVASDGNISARLSKYLFLITPAGFCKGRLKQHEMIRLSIDGKPISLQSKFKPSTEYQLHIAVYNKKPEINAIIHAHPAYTTALASAKTTIMTKALNWFSKLSEIQNTVGKIAIIDDLPPGSKELADAVAGSMAEHNAGLMINHGVVVVGEDLTQALYRLERVELAAKLYLLAELFNQIPDTPD
jgi:L-fuculose-phosphate aldolase